MDPSQGCLYVVATPIGNLEDVTHRALRVLREADLIAAEDTRHTRKLLNHYEIGTPVTSYHDHNEATKAESLVMDIQSGKRIALVTDAGTPCISDPGYRLVRLCHEERLPVVAVPGPCAAVAALSIAGLPASTFTFHGFFPRKASDASALLTAIAAVPGTHVFYEAPNRLAATLHEVAARWPDTDVYVARELTKLHEELMRGPALEIARRCRESEVRGECVVIVAVPPPPAQAVPDEAGLRAEVEWVMTTRAVSRRDAVREIAGKYGIARKAVYAAAVLESDS
ncbi:MAG: ribosomal RNA small subunit methyltransferase I [Candidatus Hydrogenedentota bacterium]